MLWSEQSLLWWLFPLWSAFHWTPLPACSEAFRRTTLPQGDNENKNVKVMDTIIYVSEPHAGYLPNSCVNKKTFITNQNTFTVWCQSLRNQRSFNTGILWWALIAGPLRSTNRAALTSLFSLAMAMLPSLLYLIGDPPSCISVPYPVAVKKAGIPAPPALILSASVPCGEKAHKWKATLNRKVLNTYLGAHTAVFSAGSSWMNKRINFILLPCTFHIF